LRSGFSKMLVYSLLPNLCASFWWAYIQINDPITYQSYGQSYVLVSGGLTSKLTILLILCLIAKLMC